VIDIARTLLQESIVAPTVRKDNLFVPLKIGTEISGEIVLLKTHSEPQISEARARVLVGVADQVALAIKRAFLETRAREADRLEREQARSRAAKAEAIAVLAGGLAHELNNILTGVLGNVSLSLEILRDRYPITARLQDALTSAERAAAIVAQMLAYAGKGCFIKTDIALSEVIREFVKTVRGSIAPNVQLETDLADIPLIEADLNQIRQLIGNLYLNAVEAIGSNDGMITLSTGVQRIEEGGDGGSTQALPAGDYVCLRISDTGCGIDEQSRPKIFDPFFTTKFVGRGLGLAAADGIMRALGGVIRVSSEPGRGSTFTCLFPVVSDAR
jgi:signal transduction histidine kinase